jgi:hypothetical protein
MNFQLTRRLSADLACLGGLRRLPDENALLRKRLTPHTQVIILPRGSPDGPSQDITFVLNMSQFLRPLAIFSSSWSRSCIIRTPKQSRSFVKPLLWGTAVSIFSAAYTVQSTTIHLDAEPSLPDSEFESMFHRLTGLVQELKILLS